MNFRKFAFDVDGCLVNKQMSLLPGAAELISTIIKKVPDAEICIASGASLHEVQYAIDLVQKKLPCGQKFEPKIISFGGGFVKLSNNNCIENPFFKPELQKMYEIINSIDNNCAICHRTKTVNFYTNPNLPQAIIDIMKTLPKSFGILDNLKDDKYLKDQISNNGIYGLEIISPKNKEIFEALTAEFAHKGFIVSQGTCIEINKIGKVNALKNALGNLNNVVYFGDGYNDIPCFKECALSFGIGPTKEATKHAKHQIETHFEPIEILFGKTMEK